MTKIGKNVLLILALLAFMNLIRMNCAGAILSALQAKSGDFHCPAGLRGKLPDPSSCVKYYECDNGEEFVSECENLSVFNPLTERCDAPYNVPGCDAVFRSD